MRGRFFGPTGLCVIFTTVTVLVVGGLSWVTAAALEEEQVRVAATVRAERANQERLALWRLDGQVLPILELENTRTYAHYLALHEPSLAEPGENLLRLPSPLLSAELPEWMVLHFQIDPDSGWTSPQVISPTLSEWLRGPDVGLSLENVTEERAEILEALRYKFQPTDVLAALDAAQAGAAG